jgi:hypothetical protein
MIFIVVDYATPGAFAREAPTLADDSCDQNQPADREPDRFGFSDVSLRRREVLMASTPLGGNCPLFGSYRVPTRANLAVDLAKESERVSSPPASSRGSN